VEAWKRDTVDYNGYEQYGAIFDRSIPWKTEKQSKGKKPRKN